MKEVKSITNRELSMLKIAWNGMLDPDNLSNYDLEVFNQCLSKGLIKQIDADTWKITDSGLKFLKL